MTKLIAIGGGYNGGEFDRELEAQIHSFIPKEHARVIFVPYGSPADMENYQEFREIYMQLGSHVSILEHGKEVELLDADLIYFGRGSTIGLVNALKGTVAISYIHESFKKGTILAGFSAGANALFETAGSYEEGIGFTLVTGLGFIQNSVITHYNYKERANAYHKLLSENKINGIGLEDHTMIVVEDGILSLYTSKPQANGYMISVLNGSTSIQPIKKIHTNIKDC